MNIEEQKEEENRHHSLKYRKEFCASLIAHMAGGESYISWGAKNNPRISKTTQYEWEAIYPEWKEAKEIGYSLGLSFYETLLKSAAMGLIPESLREAGSKRIDLSAVIFALKTRFHAEYGENKTINHTSEDNSLQITFVKPKVVE